MPGHPAAAHEKAEKSMIGSKIAQSGGLRVVALLIIVLLSGGCGERGESPEELLADARQQREKADYAAATIQLKNLLQKSPDNAEARYLLGVTYVDTGDFRSAEKELQRALELRYDPVKVIPPLGKSLLMLGEFQKVLDQARVEGEASNAVQAEILTLRALASLGLRRNKEASELFDQALVKQPEFADALLGQARLAASEKKFDDATRLIERALASAPKSVDAWLMKGDLARIMGSPEAAAAAYQKVLELSPDNVAARLNTASLQIAAGNFDEARKQVDQIRKISPGNLMASYTLALIEFRKNNYAAARDEVLKVLKVAPDHLPSMLLAGAVYVALGSHAQAQASLARVIDRAPGNLYARKLLISSLAKSGQVPRALEMLQPALKQAPGDGALLALAGEVYLQSNEFAKAGEFFDKAVKLDPKSAGARTGLGLSHLASGETNRALADLESAVELDSDKYQADILLVMSHLQRSNYDQALKALESLEKKQPDNPMTYNLKAAIYIGKKDTASARKFLEHALELRPTYAPAAANLAQLDLQENNPKAARGRFEAILEKDGKNTQALLALANLAPRIGASKEERLGWLERARAASPGSVQPLLMLAQLHAQAGDAKKALEAAQQAQAIGPDNPEVLDTLGAMQLGAGEKENALATFGKLAAQQPNSPAALYRLATAQAANANPTAAAGTLRKALALKPDFVDAQVALVELELRAGRYPEAMKIAQQVQKQAAKSPLGFALEGDVLMAEKKFPQAAKAYETAYGIGPNGLLAIKLHAAYSQAGKPEEAEAAAGAMAETVARGCDGAALRGRRRPQERQVQERDRAL